ncbi:hypothetical protein J4573_12075 [Actinomadura barringtoniae]|uniref:Peptidase S1 domain-containing protein n=2 Tax=Actinomadura barringtoniae TaxID=1427535 RepID=A0A939T1L3_9ACTN|nr:trypsin-like serine protease [Actinomadura barringtoniae]MBO2447831.1 hypothetical protein [Actinomadura barringtoniae]
MCKYGQVTQRTCGVVTEFTDNVMYSWAGIFPGDSGGGVVLKGGFAGVNSAINPSHANGPFQFTNIAGILADLNKQGPQTVGIGFQPLRDGDSAMS